MKRGIFSSALIFVCISYVFLDHSTFMKQIVQITMGLTNHNNSCGFTNAVIKSDDKMVCENHTVWLGVFLD